MSSRAKASAQLRAREFVRHRLPDFASGFMQLGQYWPHEYSAECYSRPTSNGAVTDPTSGLPVPPAEFWAHYCTTAESFLASGWEDVETMTRLLTDSGAPVEEAGRILELGCAGGRMLRWLAPLAPDVQLWGTDIWSSAIMWCQDHLSPPCHFATTTTVPHLPFEDRSFGLVYCGSVFTHLDDLADTWFLELHRVLRPGGRLYFSINDRNALRVFDGKADPESYPRYWERAGSKENWDEFVAANEERPDYQRFHRGEAYMVTMGRSLSAHVMWDAEVLCTRLGYGYRKLAITPESYGHQTTVLLERI